MEQSYQKLLNPVHHLIANGLTFGFYAFMCVILRPYTFSPEPLIAQIQACFAAVPVAATFWFATYMFLVVLMDQLKQAKVRADS